MKTPILLTLLLAAQLAHAENSDTAQCDRAADPLHPGNPSGVRGVEQPPRFDDDNTAWDALRLACENSYAAHPDTPRYAYQLARLYQARDYNVSAEKYLKTAAEQGDPLAQNAYGNTLNDQGYDGSEWLEKAAAQNIPEAQYHLALLLLDAKHGLNITALNKTPVTSERKRGVELLTRAAEAGVPEAQAMLAALYHHGVKDVLEKDNGKHIAWQEKAAEKIAYTAYLTGEGYETGLEGFPADCEKAKYWYQKAHDLDANYPQSPSRDLCAPKTASAKK